MIRYNLLNSLYNSFFSLHVFTRLLNETFFHVKYLQYRFRRLFTPFPFSKITTALNMCCTWEDAHWAVQSDRPAILEPCYWWQGNSRSVTNQRDGILLHSADVLRHLQVTSNTWGNYRIREKKSYFKTNQKAFALKTFCQPNNNSLKLR